MERYQDKKVVIIGGTSGMGLATAKMLLDGGARVLVTGRSKAGLESAQKELGKGAIVVSSDARSLTDIDALASRVKAEFDTFDLLFVNAGFKCSSGPPTTWRSEPSPTHDRYKRTFLARNNFRLPSSGKNTRFFLCQGVTSTYSRHFIQLRALCWRTLVS
jgi:NAD(P)-dependent dehydrogenase (short-subunit alcohol dehydrogenase family)